METDVRPLDVASDASADSAARGHWRVAVLGMLAVLVLAVWGGWFIERSSFVIQLVDPHRYFCLFDDAMISLRYAHNLVLGHGLVWNPGEAVEGYSDPLWVLAMAGVIAALGPDDAMLGMQILGLVLVAGLIPVVMRIAARMAPAIGIDAPALLMALAVALGVLYYPLLYWSLMGLEVGAIALALALATMVAVERRPAGAWVAPAAATVAYFLHPDAVVAFVPLLLVHAHEARADRRFRRRLIAACALAAVVVAAHVTWRWSYYGAWLPNTYTLKMTGIALGERLANGLMFSSLFVRESAPMLALAVLAWLARPGRIAELLGGPFLLLLAYQVWIGGDGWPYWRFLAPAMPLLGTLAAAGAARAAVAIGARARPRALAGWVALAAAAFVGANARFTGEITGADLPFQVDRNKESVQRALALSRVLDPSATIAVLYAGAVPYFTGMHAIDMLGKVDPYIANLPQQIVPALRAFGMSTLPGHNKFDLAHSIEATQPDYVERFNWGGASIVEWAQQHYGIATVRFEDGTRVELPVKRGSSHLIR